MSTLVIDREYLARRLATLREAEAYCRFGGADGVLTAAGLLRSVISTLEITASLPGLPDLGDGPERDDGVHAVDPEPECSSCGDGLPEGQRFGMCAQCDPAEQRLIEADLRAAQRADV